MESCRYQTGAKYYCSLDCIALFFRWILVYSVFCLSSIALVLMYCDSYFWKSWSWSWHYYQGNVNSLLLTATSQNHSFTLLHNYLVINLIEVKKKKIHLIKQLYDHKIFHLSKWKMYGFWSSKLHQNFYFYRMKATYYNPALMRPDL